MAGQQQHRAIDGGGQRREMILAHPAGDERHQRQPEQQVQVRPEDPAVDSMRGLEHVMMVVPVDAEHDEAEHVGEGDRDQGTERFPIRSVWNLQLQDHDGDQDRDHAVAERLEAAFAHARSVRITVEYEFTLRDTI